MKVLILNSQVFSEGVSFENVRYLILGDLSPLLHNALKPNISWAVLKQRIGRALRFCSHKDIEDPKDRVLQVLLFLTVLPETLPPEICEKNKRKNICKKEYKTFMTNDEKKYDLVLKDIDKSEDIMKKLETASIDADLYDAGEDVFDELDTAMESLSLRV